MTITPLPTPAPSRLQSQTEFSANVNAFVGALPALVTEINAMAPDIAAAGANAAIAAESAVSAAAIAAALGSTAGLPSLTGGAGKALKVNSSASGVEWAPPIEAIYEAFTTSGTWTKPAYCTVVYVECIGGGGAGATNYGLTGYLYSGGAGGGFASGVFRASDLASTVTVTVGAGGGIGANSAGSGPGGHGGSSSFGAHLLAYGGRGGQIRFDGASAADNFFAVTNTGSSTSIIDTSDAASWPVDGSGGGLGVTAGPGGNAVFGGGGGGGVGGAGGVSQRHGNGGAGASSSATSGENGVAPGGGGGAEFGLSTTTLGGLGARGEIRIWAW